MAASFPIEANLWVISRSMIDESRASLARLRDDQTTDALVRNSRSIIDQSRRLLAALERAASPRRSDDEHHDAIAIGTAAAIEPTAGGVGPDADRNQAMLSVGVFKKESCFGWALYSTTNELLGRGTAETEHKARIDAFLAGVLFVLQGS